ncbi:molybdopterin-guanine dinucleotide biosynthesis protein A [Actinoplanes lutulentus]|uniref:molybdenum cofactor guanylyltransferase n=1 Tax=Actinoplanes lutulentus TaxID=1287878 RepID=UPI0017B3757E|nr:NTP transferase domain-containing protein [Actinoplanes lutulentus]MBB2944734.1 molybdopterin-guanine dinucleotide biosynthesis protein A [Actinoplanes lutulentus]
MGGFAAVVLAGGAARRMGGADKPTLPVAGQSMLTRVLAAVHDADPRVVVGRVPSDLPVSVHVTREEPPGGGPVAAAAAGLALVPDTIAFTALLAADLPFLTGEAIDVLRLTMESAPMEGAVYRDAEGHLQVLCGVWRTKSLRAALDRLAEERGDLHGASVRSLLDKVRVAEVSWRRPGPPPWFDCDTDDDLRTAEEWAR